MLLSRLGAICLALPDAFEEDAWTGVRWCVGTRNFAHMVTIEDGAPPAYAAAAKTDGPAVVVTFRTPEPLRYSSGGDTGPYFLPGWFPNLVGVVIDDSTDWVELGELIEQSYRLLAPKRSVAALDAR